MITSIIIDDEPLARLMIKEYLQDFAQITCMQECNNGFEGIKAIQQHQPDLIFLDIQMPKINGFEMLELIDKPPAVIFTTAFDQFAIQAFERNAIDYLLKPFTKDRFEKAIEKYLANSGGKVDPASSKAFIDSAAHLALQNHRVVVKMGDKIKIIPVEDIQHLEAADDYVKIYTSEGIFLKNKTMSDFEKMLDKQHFVRIHRCYMVNVVEITRIDAIEKDHHIAVLKSGAKTPISKTGYARLKAVLGL